MWEVLQYTLNNAHFSLHIHILCELTMYNERPVETIRDYWRLLETTRGRWRLSETSGKCQRPVEIIRYQWRLEEKCC